MEEKQTVHHRQHFNLSESAKQMLEQLTTQRYPGRQRRQSQVIEDLIIEAFMKERNMATVANDMQEPEGNDWLAPETREALNLAQQEALRMQASEVFPEHLMLGIIAQGNNRAANVLCNAGLDMQAIRIQASKVFATEYTDLGEHRGELPLSAESQECLNWAIFLVTVGPSWPFTYVRPQHLVLAILHHPRMQPFFAPFAPSLNAIQTQLTQGSGSTLIRYMNRPDFLKNIRESVKKRDEWMQVLEMRQAMSRGQNRPVVSEFEHPTTTLTDVVGMDEARQALQKVVEFLKLPESSQHSGSGLSRGVLLVGPRSDERSLLVRAVAGEAGVPLLRISAPELVETLTQFDPVGGGPLAFPSQSFFFRIQQMIGQVYSVLRGSFDQVKSAAPAVLLIDDIDAFERVNRGREGLMNHLLRELDRLEADKPTVVIATTNHPEVLHQALLYAGRFNQCIYIDNAHRGGRVTQVGWAVDTWDRPASGDPSSAQQEIEQTTIAETGPSSQESTSTRLCPSCKKETRANWKHCVYCGASLATQCPHCGSPYPQVEDARFCFECGKPLE